MALSEIDSFVHKFKNLLNLEKDASLTLKSEAGRATVILSVELGHVFSAPVFYHRPPRNPPSRQRRHDRRAAARHSEEEASKEDAQVEEKDDCVEPLTEKAKEPIEEESTAENVRLKPCDNLMIIPDEVCPNEDYEIAHVEKSICSVQVQVWSYLQKWKWKEDGVSSILIKKKIILTLWGLKQSDMLVKTYLIVIRDDVALIFEGSRPSQYSGASLSSHNKMKTSTSYFIKAELIIIMFENKT
jgi:hypothetical protein